MVTKFDVARKCLCESFPYFLVRWHLFEEYLHVVIEVWLGTRVITVQTYTIRHFCFLKSLLQGLDAHKYKNTLDCVMRIIKYEGLKAYVKIIFVKLFLQTCKMKTKLLVKQAKDNMQVNPFTIEIQLCVFVNRLLNPNKK